VSALALWVAREPMLQLFERLGKHLAESFEAAGGWCKGLAEELRKRSRAALLAAGGLELQSKLEKDFHRIDQGFSERLGQYSGLQRQLADLLVKLDADYQRSGDSPPEVPGWAAAVESIAGIPSTDDPNVHKILDGVRRSLDEAQKKALDNYRKDTSARHKILERMRPLWKEARGLLDALKIYDAAVNLDAKRLAEGDVQMQISAIQVLLSQVFGIKLDASVANQIVALILNVAKTITTLSAELAKGWTVGSPTAQLPEGSAR